jgi:GT2 family glycosyltransferase/glycosyltransferase involved in cell wall biosynthesis
VCIPTYGAYDVFAQCLHSVLERTPPEVRVLVADDASKDPAIGRLVEEVNAVRPSRFAVGYLRQPRNVGFVHNVNEALRVLAPADVIVLNSDCVVTEGWYEGLRRAAYSDTRVATASALTNHGTIVSIPERNQPVPNIPQEWSLDAAAEAVRAESAVAHPTLPAAIGHCLYVRRSALELVGDFDEAFAPGYEEEVDFSQRCIQHGLSHVLADDVFVLHHGCGSFKSSEGAEALRTQHHELITSRYAYYDAWVNEVAYASETPLARSLAAGRRALRGMSLTVDGRILTRFMTGTQLHVLEIIVALHEAEDIPIRVIVPPDLGDYAAGVLAGLERVRLVSQEQALAEPLTDVVHRPHQVSSYEDLGLLLRTGERLVITQQDLIALHNPAYHESYGRWHEHRVLTRIALAAADQVAFFTRHARRDALREQIVEPARATVALLGTNHTLNSLRPEPAEPRGAERLAGRQFLLCLGTDFVHKNRVFAIRLLDALRSNHGWEGCLVLAGPHVAVGSSAGEEAEELVRKPWLSDHVMDLAAVDEAGKRWLMEQATAVVYPSTYEGFGLVPFEAGEVGVPCFFAPEAALGELLPVEAALLVPWDAEESANRCAELLADPDLRREHVAMLRVAGASLTWSRTAQELLAVYRAAVAGPPREARRLISEVVEMTLKLEAMEQKGGYDKYSLALVGPNGALAEDMRRPLLAIATRRGLRTLVFPPLRALYALIRLFKRGGGDRP